MNNLTVQENAVAAIRISSVKQGLQGDSPEAQKEQIAQFAKNHNIHIKKFFIFIESASKEEQPVQEAIDYCKNPDNDIQLFVIKSIDRFTRGGSYLYDHLKMQLTKYGVRLVDIYGIIGSQEVNTLEHLNIEYNWSIYSPTKKAEILEAERAKDEMRDIMTRMIGAEIRYVRMGYRVRQAPFGYKNDKIETPHGKRVVLKPHPKESIWIIKMFELRAQGTLNDEEIVEKINNLGFKTRKLYKRDSNDRTKIVGQKGEKQLTAKQLWRYISKPIYAGVSVEKWTKDAPVKAKFKGLVSIDLYNKANRGKKILKEENGVVNFWKKQPPAHLAIKQVKNPNFPYKRYVLCPECRKPLYGSASRGKLGKYYPAYHCNKRGHYFRVPKKDFDATILKFVQNLNITPEYTEKLKKHVLDAWNRQQEVVQEDSSIIETKITELKDMAKITAEKIRYLNSEVAIKYMEEDLIKLDSEIKQLEKSKSEKTNEDKKINMEIVVANVTYFLEHLEELLIGSPNRLKRAEYFSLLFEQTPTYEELVSGTPKLMRYLGLKPQFAAALVTDGGSASLNPKSIVKWIDS